MSSSPINFLSVCSGIEAASMAWEPLGWKACAFAEIEKFPSAVLAHHWPETPNLGDMTKHNDWPTKLTPNLIVGGTPCQAFSVAGLRKGLADPRGNLTLVFLGILAQFRPRWVVWENVPGVLSDKTGAFGAFIGGLGELGYGVAYRVLDAQHFGVPQRRRRVFVVGCLGDWKRAAAVLFEPESLRGDSPPSREARKETAGTLGARSLRTIGAQDAACGHLIPDWPAQIAPTLNAAFGDKQGLENQHIDGGAGCFVPALCIPIHDKTTRHAGATGKGSGNGLGVGKTGDPCPTLTAGDKHAVAVGCFKGGQGSKAGSIGYSETLAPTLSASPSGTQQSPTLLQNTAVRRLTPKECERLQGFPDDHTRIPWRNKPADLCPDGPRYKAIGNSMAVPVMRWIGERISKLNNI